MSCCSVMPDSFILNLAFKLPNAAREPVSNARPLVKPEAICFSFLPEPTKTEYAFCFFFNPPRELNELDKELDGLGTTDTEDDGLGLGLKEGLGDLLGDCDGLLLILVETDLLGDKLGEGLVDKLGDGDLLGDCDGDLLGEELGDKLGDKLLDRLLDGETYLDGEMLKTDLLILLLVEIETLLSLISLLFCKELKLTKTLGTFLLLLGETD